MIGYDFYNNNYNELGGGFQDSYLEPYNQGYNDAIEEIMYEDGLYEEAVKNKPDHVRVFDDLRRYYNYKPIKGNPNYNGTISYGGQTYYVTTYITPDGQHFRRGRRNVKQNKGQLMGTATYQGGKYNQDKVINIGMEVFRNFDHQRMRWLILHEIGHNVNKDFDGSKDSKQYEENLKEYREEKAKAKSDYKFFKAELEKLKKKYGESSNLYKKSKKDFQAITTEINNHLQIDILEMSDDEYKKWDKKLDELRKKQNKIFDDSMKYMDDKYDDSFQIDMMRTPVRDSKSNVKTTSANYKNYKKTVGRAVKGMTRRDLDAVNKVNDRAKEIASKYGNGEEHANYQEIKADTYAAKHMGPKGRETISKHLKDVNSPGGMTRILVGKLPTRRMNQFMKTYKKDIKSSSQGDTNTRIKGMYDDKIWNSPMWNKKS